MWPSPALRLLPRESLQLGAAHRAWHFRMCQLTRDTGQDICSCWDPGNIDSLPGSGVPSWHPQPFPTLTRCTSRTPQGLGHCWGPQCGRGQSGGTNKRPTWRSVPGGGNEASPQGCGRAAHSVALPSPLPLHEAHLPGVGVAAWHRDTHRLYPPQGPAEAPQTSPAPQLGGCGSGRAKGFYFCPSQPQSGTLYAPRGGQQDAALALLALDRSRTLRKHPLQPRGLQCEKKKRKRKR